MAHGHDGWMGSVSRRTFAKTAAAVAASPLLLSPRAHGRTAGGRGPGPNDRITIGMIGMGIQGRDHIGRLLRNPLVQVVSVCDVDTTRRDAAKAQVEGAYSAAEGFKGAFKGCSAHVDYREMLGDNGLDAVLIATPDHWHAGPVIDAAAAGKHIFCEKPLSYTLMEAKWMMDAVKRHNVIFQTGSQQRTEFGGLFRTACEHVRNGRIGRVLQVVVGVPSRGPGVTTSVPCDLSEEPMEPGLDWDRWLGPAPVRPYNSVLSPRGVNKHYPDWRLYREYSGGMLTDFGAHHFDIAQWGLGMDDSGPVEVIPPRDEKSPYGAKFVYANGVELTHGGPIGVTFIGERGTISVDRGVLKSDPESVLKEPAGGRAGDGVQLGRAKDHHADWIDGIRTGRQPVCHVEVGARSVACCHLMNLAYWHRRRLKWDPQKWEFAGDGAAEANGWRDYERREGYGLTRA